MDEGPNPDENEESGARLGRISPSGWEKRRAGASSGGQVEMLLHYFAIYQVFFCNQSKNCFLVMITQNSHAFIV
jgi:hypothetical protein